MVAVVATLADQGAARRQLLDQQVGAGVVAHLALCHSRIMGLPCSSHTAWSLDFNPPLVRPMQRERRLFSAGWRPSDAL
jgi:hypothetical protein